MTAQEFNLRERIIGATKSSIILRGDNEDRIFCSNKLFNKLMMNPELEIRVGVLNGHWVNVSGGKVWYEDSKWLEAFIPTRF